MQTTTLIGIDLALIQDFTAVVVVQQELRPRAGASWVGRLLSWLPGGDTSEGHYAVSWVERLRERDYVQLVGRIRQMLSDPRLRDCPCAVDITGVGRPVLDMLREANLPVWLRPVIITGGHQVTPQQDGGFHIPKKELATVLNVLLQFGRLRLAHDPRTGRPISPAFMQELHAFSKRITTSATEKFEARAGATDDIIMATALACWLGENTAGAGSIGFPQTVAEGRSVLEHIPPGVCSTDQPRGEVVTIWEPPERSPEEAWRDAGDWDRVQGGR
jgi:hypothetical protein